MCYIYYKYTTAGSEAVQLVSNPERSSSGRLMIVMWERPNPLESRGIITHFQVNFSEATVDSNRRKRQEICQTGGCALASGDRGGCCVVPPDHTSVIITGLGPSQAYTVTVSAGNGAGLGEKSKPLTVQGE